MDEGSLALHGGRRFFRSAVNNNLVCRSKPGSFATGPAATAAAVMRSWSALIWLFPALCIWTGQCHATRAADIDVCPEIPASCPTCSLHVDEILDNICKQNIVAFVHTSKPFSQSEDEEEKLCGDLEVTETFGLHKNHFNDVLSASLRKDCACDVTFGAGHPVHVLANATSFNGIPTLSQLVLNDGVTLLQHSARNQEELAAALKNCQLEKKMDVGHGDYSSSYEGANVYKQAYVVKTVKYVYPAPSYDYQPSHSSYHAPAYHQPSYSASLQCPNLCSPSLQCTVVCSPKLHRPVVRSPKLQRSNLCAPKLQCPVICATKLQCPVLCSPKLQCPIICSPSLQRPNLCSPSLQRTVVCSPKLQRPVVRSPKLQRSLLRSTELQCPDLCSPKLQCPIIYPPKLQCPIIRSPKLQCPIIRSPKLQCPIICSPKLQCPIIRSPKLQCPIIRSPKLHYSAPSYTPPKSKSYKSSVTYTYVTIVAPSYGGYGHSAPKYAQPAPSYAAPAPAYGGEDEEEKLCGDLEVTETFGLHKNHFNDVLSASLRKDCACDVTFGAGHPVHVLANATSFNGIPTLSQLVLNDGVTLLQHSARNQEELAAALKNCQLEKKMDVGHGDYSSSYEGANVYKQAYVVKTVKYVYPAPSYDYQPSHSSYHAPAYHQPSYSASLQCPNLCSPSLQCTVVCSPKLHRPVVRSPKLQRSNLCAPKLQCPVICATKLQCPVLCSPKLQCPIICSPSLQRPNLCSPSLQRTVVCSPKLQRPVVRSPKLQRSLLRSTELQCPDLCSPKLQCPIIYPPKLQCPIIRSPKLQCPIIRSPKLQCPIICSPKLQCPIIRSPKLQCPIIRSPKLHYSAPSYTPPKSKSYKSSVTYTYVTIVAPSYGGYGHSAPKYAQPAPSYAAPAPAYGGQRSSGYKNRYPSGDPANIEYDATYEPNPGYAPPGYSAVVPASEYRQYKA
ncbi:hypothetical protein ISCGN_032035 [Ixodes scapularis]